jgi:hypothetical protein
MARTRHCACPEGTAKVSCWNTKALNMFDGKVLLTLSTICPRIMLEPKSFVVSVLAGKLKIELYIHLLL